MVLGKDWRFIWKNIRRGNYHVFLNKLYRSYFSLKGHDGIAVMEEDWDHLIILDACRYDTFKETNWIDGTLEKRISKGTATHEWLRRNFTDYYDDVVYVAANPFVSPDKSSGGFDSSEHFHDIIPVYLDDDAQEDGVTRPEAVTTAAIKAQERYPEKRKIIHYNQPHAPYIGEPRLTWENTDKDDGDLFQMFTDPRVKEAYRENLKRALTAVEDLLQDLTGRIVISADHGETFGEKGLIEHPPGIYVQELVEVPWLIIEQGERPTPHDDDTTGIDL